MRTLVIGASEKPDRYSNKAIKSLLRHGFEALPLGIRAGTIEGLTVLTGKPGLSDIDTVTL
ncbi:MAG: putative CoA-binding protein [Limisphaerales bacterium]|jgi:predicted CoA-binding protein